MPDVLTFGELMLRLSPPGFQRLRQASEFEITFGGAEANAAVQIAQLGGSAGFVSKLPRNEIAERSLGELRGLGVDVSQVVRGGDRMGIYFLEQGAGERPCKVVYDRAHSAVAEAQAGEFDWDAIFAGASWFHWSGITPAISKSAATIVRQACLAAKKHKMTVSLDVNYRATLWTAAGAGAVLAPMMDSVDLCVCGVEETQSIFGIEAPPDAADREVFAAHRLLTHYRLKLVALTMRQTTNAGNSRWGAMLYNGNKAFFSRVHEVTIVDRIGAGDSFTGALIFALRRGDDEQRAVDFAVAASCLKQTMHGDYTLATLQEVEAVAGGAHGGRVQR